ncbi:restriction endonuclease subunit S [Methanococcus aeolicus]|uniref:restriction endonuclease subunit S n=1 Tax=Methanococcus aeolicus TaxID=42879 RepID=UPI0021C6D362|nr:restriction endonuclease subunit S [Methanococcus aeolicus]UXM84505.1 restriction endonuclease subunit S [Methanococcus aeolicus]
MNKIEKLINELCPDGVEFKELGEFANVTSAGVDKKIRPDERKIKLLNFMDVYRNKYLNKQIPSMEVTANENKILKCNIKKGDIFITPSSEVINDIGNSAVAIEDFPNTVYSYHIMRIRLKNPNIITSMFINYLFESYYVQNQINKKAHGITRFGLTKTQWEKIKIPIPPLPIQEEIVKILDNFTELESELESELEARKKQYEYYKEELLTFGDDEVEWKELGELCIIGDGLHGTPKYDDLGNYYFINGNNLKEGKIVFDEKTKKVTDEIYEKHKIDFISGKTIFMSINGTIGNLAFFNGEDIVLGKSVAYFNILSKNINLRFLYYFLQTNFSKNYYDTQKTGSTIKNLGLKALRKFKIPIPPIEKQKQIVAILDKFDALVNDISEGLPAEIKARKQQYEYYREKLLTFKEKKKSE